MPGNQSKFFLLTKHLAITFGIFPNKLTFQNHSLRNQCYNFYTKFCLGLFNLYLLTSFVQLFVIMSSNPINFTELSKNLIITPLFSVTVIRQICMSGPGFKKLILHLSEYETYLNTTTDKKVVQIRQASDRMITRNIVTYLVMMIITEISYTVRPLLEVETTVVKGNQTFLVRPMPLSTWFPFNSDRYFYVAYIIQSTNIVFCSTFDTVGEILLTTVLVYPTIRLKILRHIFHHFDSLTDRHSADGLMKICLKIHTDITRYVEQFNSVMGTCMFLDFIQSSVHMACVLAEILTGNVSLIELVSTLAYLVILNFRLFIYYYYANEVIVLSQDLAEAVFNTNWYEKNPKIRYGTLRIIMRSQKALKYKLGIFGHMSLSKYLSILHAAYSYVMLMTTVK